MRAICDAMIIRFARKIVLVSWDNTLLTVSINASNDVYMCSKTFPGAEYDFSDQCTHCTNISRPCCTS